MLYLKGTLWVHFTISPPKCQGMGVPLTDTTRCGIIEAMSRLLIALGLVFSLSCVTLGSFSLGTALPSVSRLEILNGNGGSCNTWAVNRGTWVTANHCVMGDFELRIGGGIATVIKRFPGADVAILDGPSAPPLTLSQRAPRVGDETYNLVYVNPTLALVLFGRVSRVEVSIGHPFWESSLLIQEGAGAGASGSPILNKRGEVISMVQGSFRVSYATVISAGLPFSKLWFTLRPYTPTPGTEGAGVDANMPGSPTPNSSDDSLAPPTDIKGLSSSPRPVW